MGMLWLGDQDGDLIRFNGHTLFHIKDYINQTQDSVLITSRIAALYMDESQNLWVGSSQGLYKVSTENLNCEKVYLDEPLHDGNYRNKITQIKSVGDTLYIGTQNGLYLINKRSAKVIGSYFTNGEKDSYGSWGTSNNIGGIYPDFSPDSLWLSLSDRIYQLHIPTGNYREYISELSHAFHCTFGQGEVFEDSLLIMPSDRLGLISFNKDHHSFSNTHINKHDFSYTQNQVYSTLSINDSVLLISSRSWGTGLYNRYADEFFWLSVPNHLKYGIHSLFLDGKGYAWTGIGGRLFRSNKAITKPNPPLVKSFIDISDFVVNGVPRKAFFLHHEPKYTLNEQERNIDLSFALTRGHEYDAVLYEYRINKQNWSPIKTPHLLSIAELPKGKSQVTLRALANGTTIAENTLSFHVLIPFYKTNWFYLVSFLILLAVGFVIARFRIKQVRKEERLQKQLAEIESMALRSQINPHFIFNTLNSIKYYALTKDPSQTGDFINQFSILIRQVLENSNRSLIPLREEIAMLSNYIAIEKKRFRQVFQSDIEVDPNIDQDFFMVPPNLLQPFVENSIWHGLMHKEGDKQLQLRFYEEKETIICLIIDNGIGRKAAAEIHRGNNHKSSLGMKITQSRIEHLYIVHGIRSGFEVVDLYDEHEKAKGTKVIVRFSA